MALFLEDRILPWCRAALGPRSAGKKTGLHGACLTESNACGAGVLIAAIEVWGHD